MAVSGEMYEQDGVKLHPYLVALARWCVSCVWSTATAMLYRLLTNPLPQIMARPPRPRPAGTEHLHPVPRVECVVLHAPAAPRVDVIFVHGLYGSLGNTWRQGEWKSKYKMAPNKISLRRPSSVPCDKQFTNTNDPVSNEVTSTVSIEELNSIAKDSKNENALNFKDEEISFTDIEYYANSITDNKVFMAEKFYDRESGIDIETQFVRDLFTETAEKSEVCACRLEAKRCEVGCGCVCDDCYSSCWPRDWIKVDYPDARVISVNYTSDPHLWRPLWIKESKRLHLHERAEQMMAQLVSLGVGKRPIVWVGHSKGGLFIKQIYCEAYEAYVKIHEKDDVTQNCDEYSKENEANHKTDNFENNARTDKIEDNNITGTDETDYECKGVKYEVNADGNFNVMDCNRIQSDDFNENAKTNATDSMQSSNKEEDALHRRSVLWSNSSGFLFYSVPHRGSPLADIKTPLTARSLELTEMGRDCSLVTALHARWLSASSRRAPRVRSLVETARTLMAVLWLRIVSVDSADAGIGALCGVSVDHREICKPSSRRCILYTELCSLIHAALNRCPQEGLEG